MAQESNGTMNSPGGVGSDAARSRMRVTVAEIEREVAHLSEGMAKDTSPNPLGALRAHWADLVAQLALGPEPERRECPSCHHFGMRAATVCGYCWTKLTPLDPR